MWMIVTTCSKVAYFGWLYWQCLQLCCHVKLCYFNELLLHVYSHVAVTTTACNKHFNMPKEIDLYCSYFALEHRRPEIQISPQILAA